MYSILEWKPQHGLTIRVSQANQYHPIMFNAGNVQSIHADGDPQARHTGDTIDVGRLSQTQENEALYKSGILNRHSCGIDRHSRPDHGTIRG